MGMNFACPGCATVMAVPERLLGSPVACPACGCVLITEKPPPAIGDIQSEEKHTVEGQLTASDAERWRRVAGGLRLISLGLYLRMGLFLLLGLTFMVSPSFGMGVTLGTGDLTWLGVALRGSLMVSIGLGVLGDLFTLSTPNRPHGVRHLARLTFACSILVLLAFSSSFVLLTLSVLGPGVAQAQAVRTGLELLALASALAGLYSFCFWLRGVCGYFRDRRTPKSAGWFLLAVAGNVAVFFGSLTLLWWVVAPVAATGRLEPGASSLVRNLTAFILVLNAIYIMFLMFWFAILVSAARRLLDRKLRHAPRAA